MEKNTLLRYLFFVLTAVQFGACGQAQPKAGGHDPAGLYRFRYNLASPEVINLPRSLDEISGIAPAGNNQVFAVDDDQGDLFRITLGQEATIEKWPVGKKSDYEDLVVTDDYFYLLSSKGSIHYFPNSFPVTEVNEAKLALKGRNEFEILFKDPSGERLLMMCKSCKSDKKGAVSVYAFNIGKHSFSEDPVAELSVDEVEEKLQQKTGAFKPSAAAVHPQTGDIYIVSSINKLLVITDKKFRVKDVHKLDPDLFKQPEGLCFTPSGNLLIANEAAGTGNANILLFKPNN